MPTWVLVHSPLLGPGSWTPVAHELRAGGEAVVVPDLRPALAGTEHVSQQVALASAAIGSGPVTLVAHSGAGPLLPAIAAALAGRGIETAAAVFVDAGLPHPGRSRAATFPAEMFAQISAMSVDGWLPPWTSWWPPEELAALVPDPVQLAALVDESPRLPETLFAEPMPVVASTALGRCGYLRLSEAYDAEAATAEGQGWAVRRLASTHLALLTAATEIAAGVRALAG